MGKKAEFSFEPPIANSSMFVLPISTASAAFSRAITVASYGGRKFSSIRDAQVVDSPCVQRTSLIATGKPPRRPTAHRRRGGIDIGGPRERRLGIHAKKRPNTAVVAFYLVEIRPR